MGLFGVPLFDLNGDGKMDMLEFLSVTQNDKADSIGENDSQDFSEHDYDTDNYDSVNDDFNESDYDY